MSCAYLISLCILHAFHLMVPFMVSTLYFSFSCAMNSIYRVHFSIVVQSNVHHYKEFKKKIVCIICGGVYPICRDHEINIPSSLFLLVSWSVFGSLPKG